MRQLGQIFDYFKMAYGLNQKNKALYFPQMILIGIKTLLYMVMVFMAYRVIVHFSMSEFYLSSRNVLRYVLDTMSGFIGIALIMVIADWLFSAGLYNLYRKALEKQALTQAQFMEGIKKYALPFLAVNILLGLFWIVIAIPYVIIGFVTLFVGFALVPILVSILTAMWKISIVIDGKGVFEGLSKSIAFGKKHFKALGALVIVQNAFLAARTGGGNSTPNLNMNLGDASNFNMNSIEGLPNQFGGSQFIGSEVHRVTDMISGLMVFIIPVVGIATFVAGLVTMVIDVFFKLSFFVMYAENRVVDRLPETSQVNVQSQREVF